MGRLWPEGVPQIRNEHGSACETDFVSPVTGYAHDEAGNRPKRSLGVYLGMVGHKIPKLRGQAVEGMCAPKSIARLPRQHQTLVQQEARLVIGTQLNGDPSLSK